ncbi:MAG: putative pyridine nucleotide-disulfide oxidoreductase RclA [Chlamydiales bacterium]|nr:putative pyridine nucleotide-disulfide oxidoreductase RclA [Chlamydiales bacterium]
MRQKFDAIIIGTGQSGPSLAARFSAAGKQVAIIERLRFGGTCVNNGCTPTKALVANAKVAHQVRNAKIFGIDIDHFSIDMKQVKARKDALVQQSSQGVEAWLRGLENCKVFDGQGVFIGPHTVQVGSEKLEGEQIFINVGGRAVVPKVPGLEKIPYFTNSSLMEIDFIPKHLVIVGGGYIALEFGQIFRRLGSAVTILQRGAHIMSNEDKDISDAIFEILTKEGIEILTESINLEICPESTPENLLIQIEQKGTKKQIHGTHLLFAAGRIPNTGDLQADRAGVELDKKGFIKVNDQLQTSQSHIYAIGDCNGKGAFTHTSYNDYEIVADNLLDGANRKVTERIPIYGLFIDPPLGRVGMSEKQVQEAGLNALVATLPMTRVARAREKGETDGFMKILVDADTQLILGASFLGTGCDEVVQMIADMMYAKAPFTIIQKAVHIHPTVTELIPTLLASLKPLNIEMSTV